MFSSYIILMNSCGYCSGFLGSVADYCARQADCSVMIVKKPASSLELMMASQNSEKKVMLVAIDKGEPLSALEWTLNHF